MNSRLDNSISGNYGKRISLSLIMLLHFWIYVLGQETGKPDIHCIMANQAVRLDGWLNEADWNRADSITCLAMVEPEENGMP
ncbi:MAG: hypothetical protein KAT31_01795, partial [Bacteroidales bacterium]|nr:hypothetical protein [Bacteroidales bacterium]